MQITKAIFDEIAPGEIFRVVTTRIQAVHDPMNTMLTFACVKGKKDNDWAIYAAHATSNAQDAARYGEKVRDKENIQAMCPCDDEVLQLYRQY